MTVALMAVAVQAAMELLEPWPTKIALDVMIYMSWRFTMISLSIAPFLFLVVRTGKTVDSGVIKRGVKGYANPATSSAHLVLDRLSNRL